uniref:Sorting nexin-10B-like n=1 Tax=Cyprinus carpio TaxID=7962 RepID=A0A8C1LJF7_CYPCA
MQEFTGVWVRDPRIQKEDFWHAYMDYEICIHTNSLAFTKKSSCVRRRYSEFVWLRKKLQENAMLITHLPKLPPKNPFFSLNNAREIGARMEGLRKFLEELLTLSCHRGKRSRNGHGCQSHSTVVTALKTEQTFTFTKFKANTVLHLMLGFSTRDPPRGLGIYE